MSIILIINTYMILANGWRDRNRIFWHAEYSTNNWNSGNYGVDTFFSKKQIQSLSTDTQTRGLNDLGEKYLKMVERAMEDQSIQRAIDNEVKLSRVEAYSFMYCGYVHMHMRCIKEKYLMIMNGQVGYNGWDTSFEEELSKKHGSK